MHRGDDPECRDQWCLNGDQRSYVILARTLAVWRGRRSGIMDTVAPYAIFDLNPVQPVLLGMQMDSQEFIQPFGNCEGL